MRTKILIGLCVSAGVILGGCGSKADDPDATGSATNNPSDPTNASDTDIDPSDTDDPSATDPSDTVDPGDTSETDPDTGSDPTTVGFISDPDGMTGVNIECDVWAQDCPKAEKCMPWANDGGGAWNATRCSPLDPNPAQVGDECTVDGSGVSGIDNCELGTMCWNVGEEGTGTCVGFCEGSEANPVCPNPNELCAIANGGVLILCLPSCDPLLQDCIGTGEGCYPIADNFACAPDASGAEEGAYGDACAFLNVCDPGLWCAPPGGVPNCQGGEGCCAEFCDISNPGASAECPGAAGGEECIPWYEPGNAPPGTENYGVCQIPT